MARVLGRVSRRPLSVAAQIAGRHAIIRIIQLASISQALAFSFGGHDKHRGSLPRMNLFRKRLSVLSRGRIAAIVVCSLGGTTFGYDMGAISSATQELAREFQLSPVQVGT